jgi:hypothetical protein
MKGDFSRNTFRPEKPITRVLAQQGRVNLDSDTNEAQAVLLERMRLGFIDKFGPFGGPLHLYDSAGAWQRDNQGFLVTPEVSAGNLKALKLGAGRYYVDGWACSTAEARYAEDMDQPLLPMFPENLVTAVPFFVYLDVWERLRTSLDDPFINDVALNGIDTCARAELVLQVRFLEAADLPQGSPPLANITLGNIGDWWPKILEKLRGANPGLMKAVAQRPSDAGDNACLADAQSAYIGPENQFYRVEIHKVDPNPGGAVTFKFSRNNGSDAAALEKIGDKFLRIGGVYEPRRGFSAGQWVEITSDSLELSAQPGTMVKVLKVEGQELTIDPATADGSLDPNDFPLEDHPKVRRWDQTGKGPLTLKNGAIELIEGEPIPLEYGIQVEFQDVGGPHTYRSGDYWTFPARYLSGDVEWPKDTFLPPQGVIHSYAPLAVVKAGNSVVDLRFRKDPWA